MEYDASYSSGKVEEGRKHDHTMSHRSVLLPGCFSSEILVPSIISQNMQTVALVKTSSVLRIKL